jgi:transcriptional regulator with XRE-family HTH domain
MDFAGQLRALMEARGLSMRALARSAPCDVALISRLANGKQWPSQDIARRLDEVLGAAGQLAAAAARPGALTPDEEERLALAAAEPRRADAQAAESLSVMLAAARHLEDRIGSAAVAPVAAAQMALSVDLAADARGPVRPALVSVAAQWAQFRGWLAASMRRPHEAERAFGTALGLATEVADTDMIATVMSMRGFLAWQAAKPGAVIGLSRAAQRHGASAGVRAIAAQQEARGHAMTGDADLTDRKLGEALALAAEAATHPASEPPWVYFYSADYLAMQRGRACLYLRRYAAAAELLAAGLEAIAPGVREAEWAAWYLADLAAAYKALGERGEAAKMAAEVARIAAATASPRLAARAAALR